MKSIFPAVLFIGAVMAVMSTMLSSCSSDDNSNGRDNVSLPPMNPLAEQISGTWYGMYEVAGTVQDEKSGESVGYSQVADVYSFEKDGSGTFMRLFFAQDHMWPAIIHGQAGYGDFTYNTTEDGKVGILLKNDYGQSYPQTWSVDYAENTIAATGVHGQNVQVLQASQSSLDGLDQWLGNKRELLSYSSDYRPVGVDNSQWMKPLNDSRLICDLSLPGSHDACTGNGWKDCNNVIAEAMAKTQDLTIEEQLKVGVRVFDLRPERVLNGTQYELRCSHGVMQTSLLVSEFFQLLKNFLAANPTEFCVLTVDLSATNDMDSWKREYNALVNSDDYKSMFAAFKPRLTVGEMRGHVLMLSLHEYADTPLGGYCYGWVNDQELAKQQQGYIKGAAGVQTPLWVQDYWVNITREKKDQAITNMLEASVARDITAANPAWVINFPSAYIVAPLSDCYRINAASANILTVNWLASHTGSVGIIYMDFSGMDKSVGYPSSNVYETNGMKLVDAVIKQNFK